MDWFTWLSKTGLDPSLVYEYGLSFSHNELEQDDISYFNHEILQSMGISIAKHRLQILKAAKRENTMISIIPHPMSRILVAIKRTKRCLSKYLRACIHREESALALVPNRSYSARWKNAMVKRNKRLMQGNRQSTYMEPLLITNGSPSVFRVERSYSYSSPSVYQNQRDDSKKNEDCDEYWDSVAIAEEIRWDTMFQNLKPT